MTAEIIGVVGDVLKDGNDRQPQPALYFVHGSTATHQRRVNLVIRTRGDATALRVIGADSARSCGRSNGRPSWIGSSR